MTSFVIIFSMFLAAFIFIMFKNEILNWVRNRNANRGVSNSRSERYSWIFSKKLLVLIPVFILLAIGLSSYYVVSPGYKAVVFRMGKVINTTEQGLHFKIPFIDEVDKVMTEKIQRYEFGYRTIDSGPPAKYQVVGVEELMITADGKIVEIDWVLQFQISDPVNFILMLPKKDEMQEKAIRDIAEASFRQIIANSTLDDVLTTGKEKIQTESRELIQKRLNLLNSGVRIVVVQLQDVAPPEIVKKAFNDVNSARAEKERKILEAQKYYNERGAAANGEAQKIINDAEAYKARRVSVVEGEYNRIMELVPAYQKDPKLLKTTLFIDAAEEFWPKAKIIMVEGGNTMQFLPLDKLMPKTIEY
ncbi:MAG: Modulator of FtsH protease HflK [Bacteroidetes bacterium ADurb.Bin302]|nr:MAG: Modulator of FtsH protease HflK [Bacteroidetes bacterium ADurb.Bin302]